MARDGRGPALTGASAPRFLVRGADLSPGALVALPDDERRHAHVRRLRDGAEAVVLDGRGRRGEGRLVSGGGAVAVERVREGVGEPDVSVELVLGVAEPARIEWAVEKAVECGALRVHLFAAERSQASHVAALGPRVERLRRIAAEATKQCGRSVVPEIAAPAALDAALGRTPAPRFALVPGGAPLRRLELGAGAARATVVIGPEGGFSAEETRRLESEGALLRGLGPRVLRLETAVVVALARLVDTESATSGRTDGIG